MLILKILNNPTHEHMRQCIVRVYSQLSNNNNIVIESKRKYKVLIICNILDHLSLNIKRLERVMLNGSLRTEHSPIDARPGTASPTQPILHDCYLDGWSLQLAAHSSGQRVRAPAAQPQRLRLTLRVFAKGDTLDSAGHLEVAFDGWRVEREQSLVIDGLRFERRCFM